MTIWQSRIGGYLAALTLVGGLTGFNLRPAQGGERDENAPGLSAASVAEPDAQRLSHLTWTTLPELPDALGVAGPFAGVSGGALIVAGGANFPHGPPWEGGRKVWHDAIYVLSAPAGRWTEAGRLPRPLAYGVSATTPRGLVCAGGGDAERHHADVFVLERVGRPGRSQSGATAPDGNQRGIAANGRITVVEDRIQIQSLPPLPRPCANACGGVLGETLYLAGGEETPGATAALRTFWSLDLTDARATMERAAGVARSGPHAGHGCGTGRFVLPAGRCELVGGLRWKARPHLPDGCLPV